LTEVTKTIAVSPTEAHSTSQNGNHRTGEQLTRIWQEILGIESVSPDQNYFDLGGDSSLAVQMFAQIEKTFKIKLPLATLYEAPTIEELAKILRGETAGSGWSPLVAIQVAGSRPPGIQQTRFEMGSAGTRGARGHRSAGESRCDAGRAFVEHLAGAMRRSIDAAIER